MDITNTIDSLAELQVRRLGYIRSVNRIDNAAGGLVRRHLGWRHDTDEAERVKLNKRALAVVGAVYKGEIPKQDAEIAEALAPDLVNYGEARAPFVRARSEIEKTMRKLAKQLPVWPWVESVRGFGDLALAVIVAEAGDLSGYPQTTPKTPKRAADALWKRFGLTPYGGHAASTWRRKGGLTTDEWKEIGYEPIRNAESYAVLGEPLFRKQWMGERDSDGNKVKESDKGKPGNIPAHPNGPYGAVYLMEYSRFLQRGESKMHSHMHGLRCMRKAALEDLWRVWNGYSPKNRAASGQTTITSKAIPQIPDAPRPSA